MAVGGIRQALHRRIIGEYRTRRQGKRSPDLAQVCAVVDMSWQSVAIAVSFRTIRRPRAAVDLTGLIQCAKF